MAILGILFLQGFIFFIPETIFNLSEPSKLKKFDSLKNKLSLNGYNKLISSDLSDADMLILGKLEVGLKVENWYKINSLTVEDYAKKIDCEKYLLSKLVNSHYNLRFTELVNVYRIEFIKEEIKKGAAKGITLEGLSEEAGFNSRTTFYNAFVKKEGISPLEFLKMNHH